MKTTTTSIPKKKITLAEASKNGLLQLNPETNILVYQGELSKELFILDSYTIVIISQLINIDITYNLNQYLREKNIYFIYTCSCDLTGFLFNDFCDDFIILDKNGKEPKKYFIKNITNNEPGKVIIETTDNNYLKIGTGDFVTFKEISGMTELNETPPRPIIIENYESFTIEDTSKFQEYVNGGICEEVKVPKLAVFKCLSERVSNVYQEDVIEDFLNDNDGENNINDNNNNNENRINNNDNNKKMKIIIKIMKIIIILMIIKIILIIIMIIKMIIILMIIIIQ